MDPSPGQLRAARAWLGWNLDEASEASGVHRQTISRIESGASQGTRETIRTLVRTYADHGVWMDRGELRNDSESEGV